METTNKRAPFKKKGQTRGPKLEDILEDVVSVFKQPMDKIKSEDMHAEYVVCRRIYAYVSRELTNAPLRVIGALINKDHSNIHFHHDKVKHWLKVKDPLWMDDWFDFIEASEIWKQHEIK